MPTFICGAGVIYNWSKIILSKSMPRVFHNLPRFRNESPLEQIVSYHTEAGPITFIDIF